LSKKLRDFSPAPGARIARTTDPSSTALANTANSDGRLDRIPQVGLVAPVHQHRIVVGDARERRRRHRPVGEFAEDARQHGLDGGKHIVLRDEGQLDIELIELARRAIGSGVFVAEARRDLEVAIEAGHHQQLLELLRGLR
jgi:hypothetical protein